MTNEYKKREGFEGQKAIVIPRGILSGKCEKSDIIGNLYVTNIGYYPKAMFHFRKRPEGANQHIIVYCDKGEGSVTVSGIDYHISPGDFFIIPRKKQHYYSANNDNPWTIYWIHFTGSTADSIVELMYQRQGGYKSSLKYPDTSLRLFNEIYEQLEKGYGIDNLLYSNMCLSHYLTTFLFNEKFRNPMEKESKSTVDLSIEYFRNNIHRMLTLKEMADSVGLSASHFSFVFKKTTGFPPLEYFNHLKIQQACQYLLFSDMKIKDIGAQLGMNDQYYFSRAFTKVMGISPKYYRK
jgi:AraC-like DNA-binding protein